MKKNILFDTGGDGEILLYNMKRMEIDPKGVDLIMLSHYHGDHIKGLKEIHQQNPEAVVYMPQSFPEAFQQKVKSMGTQVQNVVGPRVLIEGACSTGEMGSRIIEQSLLIDTARGMIIVTGCAHPGILEIITKAKEMHNRPIYLVMGGFHLAPFPEKKIREIIQQFQHLGVQRVAPTHCSGDLAMKMFREAFGDGFVEAGCGAVIEI